MNFIVWIIFVLSGQNTNLNHIEKYVKILVFVILWLPSEETKILEFNQYLWWPRPSLDE